MNRTACELKKAAFQVCLVQAKSPTICISFLGSQKQELPVISTANNKETERAAPEISSLNNAPRHRKHVHGKNVHLSGSRYFVCRPKTAFQLRASLPFMCSSLAASPSPRLPLGRRCLTGPNSPHELHKSVRESARGRLARCSLKGRLCWFERARACRWSRAGKGKL